MFNLGRNDPKLFILVTPLLGLITGSGANETSLEESSYEACSQNGFVVSQVFCLPPSYRKDVPPPVTGPDILTVYFNLPVTEVSEVDDHKSIVTMRIGYKLKWPESRMILNTSADWSKGGEINLSPENIKHIWIPDIIIHDLVKFNKPQILNEVGALEINLKKQIYYKLRCEVTIVCKAMEFGQFPLDRHNCYFVMTSFGYDSKLMSLKGKYRYDKKNQRTLAFNVDIGELPRHKTLFKGSSSNYSAYGFDIQLSRSLGPFLLSIYLPSAMFVIMSWFSFLIPPDILPARIVLLVTLCLVLINMFNSTTARIPVSNAVTAMEVWLLACMLLVFLSLVEYAVILKFMRKQKRMSEQKQKSERKQQWESRQQYDQHQQLSGGGQDGIECLKRDKNRRKSEGFCQVSLTEQGNGDLENPAIPILHLGEDSKCIQTTPDKGKHRKRNKPPKRKQTSEERLVSFKNKMDEAAAYIFPLVFAAFNTAYWLLYLFIFQEKSIKTFFLKLINRAIQLDIDDIDDDKN